MTRNEAIEIVTHNENPEFFGPLVSEPDWSFRELYEYYINEPSDSDDFFILKCDIANRIESCGFCKEKELEIKKKLKLAPPA